MRLFVLCGLIFGGAALYSPAGEADSDVIQMEQEIAKFDGYLGNVKTNWFTAKSGLNRLLDKIKRQQRANQSLQTKIDRAPQKPCRSGGHRQDGDGA